MQSLCNGSSPCLDFIEASLSEIASVGRFTDPRIPDQVHTLLDQNEFLPAFELVEAALASEQDDVEVWGELAAAAHVLRLPSAGRHRARYEEASGTGGLWHELERTVRSKITVSKGMARIVRYQATVEPDPRWKLLKKLPIEQDLAQLELWITKVFAEGPPPADVPGLWFGLLNVERGEMTLDMHVDAGQLDDDEPDDLVIGGSWSPRNEFAHSSVLDRLYKIAHSDEESPLAEAEPNLSLAYAALAVRSLASQLDPELMLGAAQERVLAVGYHDGDSIGVGTLRRDGLSFPKK